MWCLFKYDHLYFETVDLHIVTGMMNVMQVWV